MNAIMALPGGRAPPGQNMLTPCEESRSPVEVRGSRAPRPSACRPYRSERSSPIATDAHVRDPAPAAPRGNGPQARTCCLSACSWLHLLKSWSLRQTRSGSHLLRQSSLLDAMGRARGSCRSIGSSDWLDFHDLVSRALSRLTSRIIIGG